MTLTGVLLPALLAIVPLEVDPTPRRAALKPVPRSDGYCARQEEESICHEWEFIADSRMRFTAFGYEDGVEYTFHKLDRRGRYGRSFRVHPLLPDDRPGGGQVAAYPWNITDAAGPKGGPFVLATFDHDIVDESNVDTVAGQRRIPAVLFLGSTDKPEAIGRRLSFHVVSLRRLRQQTRLSCPESRPC